MLKRLRLSGILLPLPERIAYARKAKLSEENFLELVLQDEIDRRDQHNLARRLDQANFAETQTLEEFDWDAPVSFDRHRMRDLFGLGFIERYEDVLFIGADGSRKDLLGLGARPRRMPGRLQRPVRPRRWLVQAAAPS